MWLVVLKVAMIAFTSVGVAAIVVTNIRHSRTARFRQEPDPSLGPLGQMGAVPPTPLPEWACWPETDEPEEPPAGGTPPPIRWAWHARTG
jgi:hypothetical protein